MYRDSAVASKAAEGGAAEDTGAMEEDEGEMDSEQIRLEELLDGLAIDDENALPDEEDLQYLAGQTAGYDDDGEGAAADVGGAGGGGFGGSASFNPPTGKFHLGL